MKRDEAEIDMQYDVIAAHEFCSNHKPELEKNDICGCFYCLRIFHPSEIKEWLVFDNPCDERGTAVCPYCDIDAVIGESSGYPITPEFLETMHDYWFESHNKNEDTKYDQL